MFEILNGLWDGLIWYIRLIGIISCVVFLLEGLECVDMWVRYMVSVEL